MEHKKDGADVDAAPAAAAAADAIQATPERSNPKADEGVPGMVLLFHLLWEIQLFFLGFRSAVQLPSVSHSYDSAPAVFG